MQNQPQSQMEKIMKEKIKSVTALLLTVLLTVCVISCQSEEDRSGLWENATYLNDTEFGSGTITVEVEVKIEDRSVTFTLNTDKTTLGAALLEHNLIAGEESEYGLYVKVVNGITADYDIDQSYWAFYKNGEMMLTGVDGTVIANGEHYELVYTK